MLKTRKSEGKHVAAIFEDDDGALVSIKHYMNLNNIEDAIGELYEVKYIMEENKRYDERQSVSDPQ